MKYVRRMNLVLCFVIIFVSVADSLKCHFCKDADCAKSESKECSSKGAGGAAAGAAGGATTAAGFIEAEAFIEAQNATAGGDKCATYTGKDDKDKAVTVLGCTSDECKEADFADKKLKEPKCAKCDKDDCNALGGSSDLKPANLPVLFLFSLSCIIFLRN